MEPAWLQPRIQSQLLLLLAGSLKKSPKARGAGSSEQLCYLCVRFESSSCLESLFHHAALFVLNMLLNLLCRQT